MLTTALVTTGFQKDPSKQRHTIGVVTLPLGQVIPFVEFPQNPTIDIPPVNSIVLVEVYDSTSAIYICKLVDPNNNFSRASIPTPAGGEPFIDSGEYQISVGSGASIMLNNIGGIHLTSGSIKDEIVIDKDKIKVQGSTVDIHSLPGAIPYITQGFMSMDAKIGLSNPFGQDVVELGIRNPATGLAMYSISLGGGAAGGLLGEIIIKNTVAGGSIVISPLGTVTLASPTVVNVIAPIVSVTEAAAVSINALKVDVVAVDVAIDAATASIVSPIISLGGPTGQKLATEAFVKTMYDTHTHFVSATGVPTGVPVVLAGANPLALTQTTKAL